MDINAEVSAQLSLIDALLQLESKTIAPCTSNKHDKAEEETQDAMPDSTTNTEKSSASPFHCGDDVLVPNKDGRYYLGTIVELSPRGEEAWSGGAGAARCLVKFGDGTHAWAALASLKLLSAPPPADGRVLCVVCKRRDAVLACHSCGRGYHARCHAPSAPAAAHGASWECKRCVEQRYKVAAAETRALKRGSCHLYRRRHNLSPPCDTASTTSSTASEAGKEQNESNCYCGQKSDYLAQTGCTRNRQQMLLCCRCDRWFHQRCVSSLQYPLYAGDKLYIFACAVCNGGAEYLRRLELCWLELAHLALYNLTVYNSKNYFDLDTVIMPYIADNWHALQLPDKMWRAGPLERRERILTALTSSRKRFKCGREMKKRATIWGLRLRRPPPPHHQLARLHQVKKSQPLTDSVVRALAPRLRFLPRAARPPEHTHLDSSQPSSSNGDQSSYKNPNQRMIVPVDGHWLNLMMGKRFHENLNSNSENDSTSSYESLKPAEQDEPAPADTKADLDNITKLNTKLTEPPNEASYETPVPSLVACPVTLDNSKDVDSTASNNISNINIENSLNISTHNSRIATMNLEVSKLSTKNIIEHSKILSLQHMDRIPAFNFSHEIESSGDETSSRGTLDAIIPPLKDFQGKNNPFLMQNTYTSKKQAHKANGKQNLLKSRLSLPMTLNSLNPLVGPLVRPLKRKLSEKDIIIGPNGEVKRRKYRRPRKYMQMQMNNLNKSCPLPEEGSKPAPAAAPCAPPLTKIHGRRLRQRQEKNYYENARRNTTINNITNTTTNSTSLNSVKSLQLSPHKSNTNAEESTELSKLKSSVQSYFRAGRTYSVLARRIEDKGPTSYLIEWETGNS